LSDQNLDVQGLKTAIFNGVWPGKCHISHLIKMFRRFRRRAYRLRHKDGVVLPNRRIRLSVDQARLFDSLQPQQHPQRAAVFEMFLLLAFSRELTKFLVSEND
jgi:hypothetical protein